MIESKVFNMDCMEGMRQFPDNHFELAIVDPPYGSDNIQGGYTSGKGGGVAKQKQYNKKLWEFKAPNKEYWTQLFRVSKNQIVWGANHYPNVFESSSGWVYWDKQNGDVSFSDGELAYTSFNVGLRSVKIRWSGMLQHDMKNKEIRLHPTQKPVKLYEWLLMNYAKEGDKILDTHLGSGSSRIAAHNLGFDFTGYELDKDYFDASVKRYEQHIAQLKLF